jgi:hypothetical protein
MHDGMLSAELPALPKPAEHLANRRRRLCWVAGMCLCDRRGRRLRVTGSRFNRHMRRYFEPGSELCRTVATAGRLVIEMQIWPFAPSLGEARLRSEVRTAFFHVALQYWKPIDSVLLRMETCDLNVPPRGRVRLTVTNANDEGAVESAAGNPWFCTLLQAVADMDLRQKIDVMFWSLVDSPAALSHPFVPGIVEAERLPESDACLWKGSSDEKPPPRRRRRRKRSAQADGDADDSAADSRGDDDESGPGDPDLAPAASSSSDSETSTGSSADEGGLVWQLLQAAESLPEPDDGDDERSAAGSTPESASTATSSDSSDSDNSDDTCDSAAAIGDDIAIARVSDEGERSLQPQQSQSAAAPASSSNSGGARLGRQAALGLSVFRGADVVAEECIKYNPARDEFYAVCKDLRHGRCVATRSAHGGRRAAQGRPLGFLAAWVVKGDSCSDRAQHMTLQPSQADRLAARSDLAQPLQEGLLADFLAKERARREDEAEEPEACP